MDVNELLDRVLEISHDEVAPDTALTQKAMRWLNSAYLELIDECQPLLGRYLNQSTVATLTGGEATLSDDTYRIIRVVDKTTGRILDQLDVDKAVDIDPKRSLTGSPRYFWLDGSDLKVSPMGNDDDELDVFYTVSQSELVEGGAASTILFPAHLHHHLVWGAVVWASVYERSFSTQGELSLFQRKWDEAKRNIKISLVNMPSGSLRVKSSEVV